MNQTGSGNTVAVLGQYQPVEENPEVFLQKRIIAATSPDGRYQVLAGRKYHNLLLYDTQNNYAALLKQDAPYSLGQKVTFVDRHTFCVDGGELVSFFNARTGEHVDFLEMQFGYKAGQKSLLGFIYDEESRHFAALYVNEEPAKVYAHKYWAALFERDGRLLDTFRTGIELVQHWGKIVTPRLSLCGDELTVKSKKFSGDYVLRFYEHTTKIMEKAIL